MESLPGHSGALGCLHISYWPSLALMAWGLTDRHAIVTRRGPCSPSLHSFPALAGSQVSGTEAERDQEYEPEPKWERGKSYKVMGGRGSKEDTISSTRSQTGTQPRVTPSQFHSIAWPQVATWVSWPDTSCPPAGLGEPTWQHTALQDLPFPAEVGGGPSRCIATP